MAILRGTGSTRGSQSTSGYTPQAPDRTYSRPSSGRSTVTRQSARDAYAQSRAATLRRQAEAFRREQAAPSPSPAPARAPQVSAPKPDMSFTQDFNRAARLLRRQRNRLDGQYKRQRRELESLYQFEETRSEKRQIARRIAELDRRRDRGIAAIDAGFADAVGKVGGRGDIVEGRIGGDVDAITSLFSDAAGRIGGYGDWTPEGAGQGLAVGADGGSDLSDWVGFTEAVGAAEGASERRQGQTAVEDIRWLADTLSGESQIRQGEFRESGNRRASDARAQHEALVAQRVAQERQQYASQVGALQESFRNAGMSLTSQEANVLAQLGDARRQSSQSAAQMALSAAQANASNTLSAQQSAQQAAMQQAAQGLSRDQFEYQQYRDQVADQQAAQGSQIPDEVLNKGLWEFASQHGRDAAQWVFGDDALAGAPQTSFDQRGSIDNAIERYLNQQGGVPGSFDEYITGDSDVDGNMLSWLSNLYS